MLRMAVTTRAETFERMAGPLGERGIEVGHVDVTGRAIPLDASPFAEYDVGYVYPSRLMEGGVADALLGVPWVNDRAAVLASRNKAEVIARLDAAGVPVPETTLVSNPVDEATLVDVFDRFDPPVVVKPNSTTRGVGVAKAADLDSFLGILDYLGLVQDFRATGDRSFLVQEFLPDATDYRVMVLDGAVVGAVRRRLPAEARAAGRWKHNVHRGAEATAVDLPADLRELVERTATVLGVSLLGVDLLVTDDRSVVGETNARPTIDDGKYHGGFYDALADLIRKTVRTR